MSNRRNSTNSIISSNNSNYRRNSTNSINIGNTNEIDDDDRSKPAWAKVQLKKTTTRNRSSMSAARAVAAAELHQTQQQIRDYSSNRYEDDSLLSQHEGSGAGSYNNSQSNLLHSSSSALDHQDPSSSSFLDDNLNKSEPSWTNVKLKKTNRGKAVKQGKDLQAPITKLPELRKVYKEQQREQSEHGDSYYDDESSSHLDFSTSEKDPEWITQTVLHHSPQKPRSKKIPKKPKWARDSFALSHNQPDDLDFTNNNEDESSSNDHSANSGAEPAWVNPELNKSPQKSKPNYKFEKPNWAEGGVALKKGASPKKSPTPKLISPSQAILKKSPPLAVKASPNRWGDTEEEKVMKEQQQQGRQQRFPSVMAPPLTDDDDDDDDDSQQKKTKATKTKQKKKQDEAPILRLKPTAKPRKVPEKDKNSYYKLKKVKSHRHKAAQDQEVVQLKKVRFDDNLNITHTVEDGEDDHENYYKLHKGSPYYRMNKDDDETERHSDNPNQEASSLPSPPFNDDRKPSGGTNLPPAKQDGSVVVEDDDESMVHLQKLPNENYASTPVDPKQPSPSRAQAQPQPQQQPPQPPMVVLDENGISPDDMYVVLKVKLRKTTAPNSKKAKKEVVRALRGIQVTVEENVEPEKHNPNLDHINKDHDPDHPLRGEPVIRLKKIPKTTESKRRVRRNNNRGFYHMRKKKSKKNKKGPPTKPMETLPTLTEANEEDEDEYEETLQLQKVNPMDDDDEHHNKPPEERDDLSYYYEFLNRTTQPPKLEEDEEDDIVQLQEVNIPGHGTKQHAPLVDENGISPDSSYVLVKIKLKKLDSQPGPPPPGSNSAPSREKPKLRPAPALPERKKEAQYERPKLKPTPRRGRDVEEAQKERPNLRSTHGRSKGDKELQHEGSNLRPTPSRNKDESEASSESPNLRSNSARKTDGKETIEGKSNLREMRRTRPSLYDNDSGSDEASNLKQHGQKQVQQQQEGGDGGNVDAKAIQRPQSLYDNDEDDEELRKKGVRLSSETDSNSGTSPVPLRHVEIKGPKEADVEYSPLTRPNDSDSQSVSSLYEDEDDHHESGKDPGEISSESLRRGPVGGWRDEEDVEQEQVKLRKRAPNKASPTNEEGFNVKLRPTRPSKYVPEPHERDTVNLRHVERGHKQPGTSDKPVGTQLRQANRDQAQPEMIDEPSASQVRRVDRAESGAEQRGQDISDLKNAEFLEQDALAKDLGEQESPDLRQFGSSDRNESENKGRSEEHEFTSPDSRDESNRGESEEPIDTNDSEISASEDDSESTGFSIPHERTPVVTKQLSPEEEARQTQLRREREQAAQDKHEARMQRVREKDEKKRLSSYTVEEANKQREKCYIWYSRLGQPNKRKMKELVAKLPPSCDITVEEIDFLPWLPGDFMCDVRQMTKLITNDELTALVESNRRRGADSDSDDDSD